MDACTPALDLHMVWGRHNCDNFVSHVDIYARFDCSLEPLRVTPKLPFLDCLKVNFSRSEFRSSLAEGQGGAMVVGKSVLALLVECSFLENTVAFTGGSSGQGGALVVRNAAAVTLTDATFRANQATTRLQGSAMVPQGYVAHLRSIRLVC